VVASVHRITRSKSYSSSVEIRAHNLAATVAAVSSSRGMVKLGLQNTTLGLCRTRHYYQNTTLHYDITTLLSEHDITLRHYDITSRTRHYYSLIISDIHSDQTDNHFKQKILFNIFMIYRKEKLMDAVASSYRSKIS